MENPWRFISREIKGGEWREKYSKKVVNGRYRVDREVKNNTGSGEARECTCMTYGHKLWGGNAGGGVQGREE